MALEKCGMWAWWLLAGVLCGALDARAATPVPLVIDEDLPRSVPWPITTGVPFPRNGLHDVRHVRLVDDRGEECRLQARVAATWKPPGGTADEGIRWLTIDFIASPGRRYHLEFGPDVRPQETVSPLRVMQNDDLVEVVTGPLQVRFSRVGPSGLTAVSLDRNGDRAHEPGEQVIVGSVGGDHEYTDQHGHRFSSRHDGDERRITVESAGPVRACVRVDGFYTDDRGRRIVRYRTRYHLFASLGLVKIVDEFGITGSTRDVTFADIALRFDLSPAGADGVVRQVRFAPLDDHAGPAIARDRRDVVRGYSSFQRVYRHLGNPQCEGAIVELTAEGETPIAGGERIGPWVQVITPDTAVTGSLRWLWQQFPKEWRIGDDALTLHLWSPRAAEGLDFSAQGFRAFAGPAGEKHLFGDRMVASTSPTSHLKWGGIDAILRGGGDGQGINKHHDLFLHFTQASAADTGEEYGRLADRQPIALASGEWNVATDVFGPLAARPNDSPYEAIYDRIIELFHRVQDDLGDYGWWAFGTGPHYVNKWDESTGRFYAEPVRFEYHTYSRETQMWWNYLRSGERKFHDWCIPSENAWIDIAVAHVPMQVQSPWNGTGSGGRTIHWRPGDWSIDGPMHHLRHHDTAEHWLRAGAQFWASYHKTLETVTLAYYITGDERFNDVIGYWRDYFGDLAGKTSHSTDVKPWFRAESWWTAADEGSKEPPRSWARMHLDWAPFASASRHKLPLLFNLATLYEATWDPAIGQVMREYADALLDPDSPTGLWHDQEFRGPSFASAPHHPHFWTPPLWKYQRVSGDPRLKDVIRRYLDVCYHANPFTGELGSYSSVHLAYGYYFTRDPRWLTPGRRELERLLPLSLPLQKPQDITSRLFNPYAPLEALTTVQREIWAMQQAQRDGITLPARAPLDWPQRSPILFRIPAPGADTGGAEARLVLWGFDPDPKLVGPQGQTVAAQVSDRRAWPTRLQPFDRVPESHQAWCQTVALPTGSPPGLYMLLPRLETGILDARGVADVAVNAADPLRIEPPLTLHVRVPAGAGAITVESDEPATIRLHDEQRRPLAATVQGNRVEAQAPAGSVVAVGAVRPAFFRIVGWARNDCWAGTAPPPPGTRATDAQVAAAPVPPPPPSSDQTFVAGRFGQALLLTPTRTLTIPTAHGDGRPLLNPRQGTIEFWARRMWDRRTEAFRGATLVKNKALGLTTDRHRIRFNGRGGHLPLHEWVHVALVWLPARQDPQQNLYHLYVGGVDSGMYRSIWWDGYGDGANLLAPPPTPENLATDLLVSVAEGGMLGIDEIRISDVPRYADPDLEFGWQLIQNPRRLQPPDRSFATDDHTTLLLHLDGGLTSEVTGRAGAVLNP